MEITAALVDKLSELSRLHFSETEKTEISKDLQRMIDFVEKLKELDLEGVEPLLHMSDSHNVLRDDVVKSTISREEAFRNAPMQDGRFFQVPKFLKK